MFACVDGGVADYDADWALGSYHLLTELGGEYPNVQIQQFTLASDGTVSLSIENCALDFTETARWRGVGDGVVEVVPKPGQDTLEFGAPLARMLLRNTSAGESMVEGFGAGGDSLGSDSYTRGRLCLVCQELGSNAVPCGE